MRIFCLPCLRVFKHGVAVSAVIAFMGLIIPRYCCGMPQSAPPKVAVPSIEEQATSQNKIEAAYHINDFEGAEDRRRLAGDLERLASERGTKLPDQYVLLNQAAELAVDGGDLELAITLADRLAGDFEVNSLQLKQTLLRRFSAEHKGRVAIDVLVAELTLLVAEARTESRYSVAIAAAEETYAAIRTAAGIKYRKQLEDLQADLRREDAEFRKYLHFRQKLNER